jgi:DNA-binding PadR family transcriptional regulator
MLKYLLLSLLAERARHGYELRTAFEELLGGTWPLNIGQIYTTLSRLEADGLVSARVVPQDLLPDRKVFELTETGEKELRRWVDEPPAPVRLRDDGFLKVVAEIVAGGSEVLTVLWRQREALFQTLADLQALRTREGIHIATALLFDAAILRVEADLRWLDQCEEELGRAR